MMKQQIIDWHRLLGLIFIDFFSGSAWNVELEKDLSVKKQLLDIIILRQDSGGLIDPLPDGLEGMKKHNLLTFKSVREPLDDWVLKELTGHYVNYRKQISSSFNDLYPEDQFQLYGVSARYPQKLSAQLELTKVQDGVYDIYRGSDNIRLIVLKEIPHAKHNAIWHLFSGIPGEIEFAARQYRGKTQEISTVLNRLFENYQLEGIPMSYTMEDFKKDYVKEHLGVLSPDEVLQQFSLDDRLKGISLEEIQQYLKNKQGEKDN
uniref:hypothetical protein n=1 Tax=Candidatus Electrothrix sp. TaxID=2170559 RepID=UPI004055E7E9